MPPDPYLSVVIPVRNERGNLPPLLRRLERALRRQPYASECIVVDDRSVDGSADYVRALRGPVPVRLLEKKGRTGKSQSLQEGFAAARGGIVAMIDGDLQYPPEAIPSLLGAIGAYDIIVARRVQRRTTFLRSFLSRSFNALIGRLLLSLPVDVQSGLKVFRKDALTGVAFSASPWAFDYQFLFQARRNGWTVGERPIVFEERFHGRSHLRTFRDGIALAWGALRLRLSPLAQPAQPVLSCEHPCGRMHPGNCSASPSSVPDGASAVSHAPLTSSSFPPQATS